MAAKDKPKNDAYSGWLWVLIVASFLLGISNFYLHASDKEKLIAAPTLLIANIAILSTIIIICAFIVTITGLQKLEVIEKEALRKADESAKTTAEATATKVLQEILQSEKFLEEVAEATQKKYGKKGISLSSDILKEDSEKEAGI